MTMVPMVVDLDSIAEHGKMMGLENYSSYLIGNRKVQAMLVPGPEEAKREIVNSYEKEFKAENRARRCPVKNEKGGIMRCPEGRNCEEDCDFYRQHALPTCGTINFSGLDKTDGDGSVSQYEPETPAGYYDSGDREIRLLNDLIRLAEETYPGYGNAIREIYDEKSRRTVAREMNVSKSTFNDHMDEIRDLFKAFLETIDY